MTDNFRHLGHHIGPAPTSAEMGLFKVPEKPEGGSYCRDCGASAPPNEKIVHEKGCYGENKEG
jgi:hypothetical protein